MASNQSKATQTPEEARGGLRWGGEAGTAENRGRGAEGQGQSEEGAGSSRRGLGWASGEEVAITRQKQLLIHRHPQRLPSIL